MAVRRLPCKVLDSDIEIVHGWFMERDDSHDIHIVCVYVASVLID